MDLLHIAGLCWGLENWDWKSSGIFYYSFEESFCEYGDLVSETWTLVTKKILQSVPAEIISSSFSFGLLLMWRRDGERMRVKSFSTGNLINIQVDLLLQCRILPQFLRNGGRVRLDPFFNVLSWCVVLPCSCWRAFVLPGALGRSGSSVLVHDSEFISIPTSFFFPFSLFLKHVPAVGDCKTSLADV